MGERASKLALLAPNQVLRRLDNSPMANRLRAKDEIAFMKTHENELGEMVDLVVKLTWTHTIFRTLFRKQNADAEARYAHPDFFLTMHDSLLCSFCTGTEILFEDKEKATSIWSLIRKAKPQVASELVQTIHAHKNSIDKIEAIRHRVCAHRSQAKSPASVFAEVQLRFNMMTEVVDLVRYLILELAGDADGRIKSELENQQLSESTLSHVADEAARVLQAFRSGCAD